MLYVARQHIVYSYTPSTPRPTGTLGPLQGSQEQWMTLHVTVTTPIPWPTPGRWVLQSNIKFDRETYGPEN